MKQILKREKNKRSLVNSTLWLSFPWQAPRMDEVTFWLSYWDNATAWRLGREEKGFQHF